MTHRIPVLRPSPVALLRARGIPHPDRAVRAGELVPVRRGVYAPADAWRQLAPWDRYLARVHAVALLRTGVVFSHESAAVLLGMPIIGEPAEVHVLADGRSTGGDRGGLRVHTTDDAREIIEMGAIALTSAAECAVDIARSRPELLSLSVADAARAFPGSAADLVGLNEVRRSSRGRRLARWSLERASPVPESSLESVSRGVTELLGFDSPELQVVIGPDRVDFRWPEDRIVGEADGDLKYDGRFGDAAELLRARRDRDARLRRAGSRHVLHWGWSDAVEFDRLDSILTAAGVRRIRPPDLARLVRSRSALRPSALGARLHSRAESAG
ncbi:type IV toxin-antitoxin system AbiEi family antitoxin domain-containing protein [Microbacterium radiodurans]|uniref:Type IV toxin-antitoxin system AbiEi family antitoxin domain-containing protein n=1 Tax=Microbacterium radiodurans TaxID=661398 RepID=A0A5J5IPV1_9MICO|nr:hypothetical protein [Microbacterium radiodurans]KAA9086656.1 hypothetical protein F6B42_06510 [Microbacterium radiodurans]